MLDLSTVNSTTIANPATLASLEGELRRVQSEQNAIEAAILLHHLERQLAGSSDQALQARFQPLVAALSALVDGGGSSRTSSEAVSEPVLIRTEAGKFQYASDDGLVDVPDEITQRPAPPSIRKQQSNLQQTSSERPVPVVYDTPDDEEEIRRHHDRLSQFQLGETHDFSAVIADIRERAKLRFDDDVLAKRFETIASSRLKEIRSSREVQELFVRPPKIGGLGLESGLATTLVAALEEAAAQLRDTLPAVRPKLVTPAPEAPTPPKVPETIPPPPPRPAPVAPVIPPQPKRPMVIRQSAPGPRPVVSDIRRPEVPKRLVGPIEELGQCSLDDFRQWGGGEASSSVRKVYEKIVLLGQESFSRRIEGVRAWRSSPVHSLYLDMSRESLEQGKDIGDIVQTRQSAGQPFLSAAEFHAIVDLNRQLRF